MHNQEEEEEAIAKLKNDNQIYELQVASLS